MGCENNIIRQKMPVDYSSGYSGAEGFSGFLLVGDTKVDMVTGDIINGGSGSAYISGFNVQAAETIFQANTFIAGDVVYLNGGTWTPARADDVDTAEAVGIIQAATPFSFYVIYRGQIFGLSGLVPGECYFLSTTLAGKLDVNPPSTYGHINKPMLVAKTATEGIVVNYRGLYVAPPFTTDDEPFSFAWFWGN